LVLASQFYRIEYITELYTVGIPFAERAAVPRYHWAIDRHTLENTSKRVTSREGINTTQTFFERNRPPC
jgi:hypothetical protein